VVAVLSLSGCGGKSSTDEVAADPTQDRGCSPHDSWVRVPDAAAPEEWADTPEAAVRAAAGEDTEILGVVDRTARTARVEVVLGQDEGVYETRKVRGRWVAVEGEGCAAAVAPQRWDEGWNDGDGCPPKSPPPDTDGAYVAYLCAETTDGDNGSDD
jgi:hypothetical protein